mmetsp:Transcript_105010/g.323913  ORF Transcript_105010/g.323913 Transcript_105010/m.323913 type:complete len:225 (+) Transcript_105010:1597-2271(+)
MTPVISSPSPGRMRMPAALQRPSGVTWTSNDTERPCSTLPSPLWSSAGSSVRRKKRSPSTVWLVMKPKPFAGLKDLTVPTCVPGGAEGLGCCCCCCCLAGSMFLAHQLPSARACSQKRTQTPVSSGLPVVSCRASCAPGARSWVRKHTSAASPGMPMRPVPVARSCERMAPVSSVPSTSCCSGCCHCAAGAAAWCAGSPPSSAAPLPCPGSGCCSLTPRACHRP